MLGSHCGQWPPYRTVQLQCRHPVVPKPGCISEVHTVTIVENISHQKGSMELPQKLKMELHYDPWFHFWDITEENWNTNSKGYMHLYVHCSISWDLEAAQVQNSRWEDIKTAVHLHNGILLGCKKEVTITFGSSMDGPG